ncbi:hypothetical protein JCM10908_000095 [Rhodotorula pacifica]|uniref:uncharacterized protein n=1 Tax=Rhodotorula pacifica TaxID=1495444 RepID=UPI00317D2514
MTATRDGDGPLRVAIVGTGLAGLSTAYLLARVNAQIASSELLRCEEIEIHLLDRSETIGMDTASLSVKTEDGNGTFRVDVPMRSINGGSHGRVRKLYQHLGVPLVKSDFSYSFSRLSSTFPPVSATHTQPPSTHEATARSAVLSREEEERDNESVPPTPPPSYDEAAGNAARPPSPPVLAAKISSTPRARPTQTTTLLYQGASGLRWPPVSFPSYNRSPPSSSSAPTASPLANGGITAMMREWRVRIAYAGETAVLAVAYLYLLVLAFVYVSLGLSKPLSTKTHISSRRMRLAQRLGLENVAALPLAEFCARHRVPRKMVEGVLIPLMAAVATVGVDQAREMPTGEVLDYIVDTFAHSHYVTDPTVGVRGIVRRLVKPIPERQIHLGVEITKLEAIEVAGGDGKERRRGYRIHYTRGTEAAEGTTYGKEEEEGGKTLDVDHVVFATQADQAARLLSTLLVSPSDPSSSSSLSSADPSALSHEQQEKTRTALNETISALQAFTYVRTLVVTHRDQSVLPPTRVDRRDLNLAVFDHRGEKRGELPEEEQEEWDESLGFLPPTSVQTTHSISPTPSLSPPDRSQRGAKSTPKVAATAPILQTTNPLVPIDPDQILSSTWFSRAFATAKSQAVLGRFILPTPSCAASTSSASTSAPASRPASLQGRSLGHSTSPHNGGGRGGGIWFVGSYIATGFPLLEGCVCSAEGVMAALLRREGISLPMGECFF